MYVCMYIYTYTKVWKKPKYNSFINKCLVFYIYILTLEIDIQSLYIHMYMLYIHMYI